MCVDRGFLSLVPERNGTPRKDPSIPVDRRFARTRLGLNHVSFFALFFSFLSLSLTLSFFSTVHTLVHYYYRSLRYVHTCRKIVLRVSINDRTQTRGGHDTRFLLANFAPSPRSPIISLFAFLLPLPLSSLFVAYISCFRLTIKHVEIGE